MRPATRVSICLVIKASISSGVTLSQNQLGQLNLSYDNIYAPEPLSYIIPQSSLAISELLAGIQIEYALFRKLALEFQYKQRIALKEQPIKWKQLSHLKLGLVYNLN